MCNVLLRHKCGPWCYPSLPPASSRSHSLRFSWSFIGPSQLEAQAVLAIVRRRVCLASLWLLLLVRCNPFICRCCQAAHKQQAKQRLMSVSCDWLASRMPTALFYSSGIHSLLNPFSYRSCSFIVHELGLDIRKDRSFRLQQ